MLVVDQLCKRFTLHLLGKKQIEGFTDVSFEVKAGCALVLIAPSGHGKSSIIKSIYRTYLPTGGHIYYESKSLGRVDLATLDDHGIIQLRRSEISYVSQFLKVLPRVTSVDIVAEPLVTRGKAVAEARERARQILTQLNIPKRLFDAYPVTFSGGEQQRVNIARALIHRPRLLLLDEPTASLDPATTDIVLEMLQELKRQGTAMVAIFHDRNVAQRIADAFYLLTSKEIEPCLYNPASNSKYCPTQWSLPTPPL